MPPFPPPDEAANDPELPNRALPDWGVTPVPGEPGLWQAALWAPEAGRVTLGLGVPATPIAMTRDASGTHRARFRAEAGTAYAFDLGRGPRPDPAARQQVAGVHGPSRLVDPAAFAWPATEAAWQGRPWDEAVILEIHIGLFTPEGTFAAAARRLPELAALGITGVELMPLGQFPGNRGWGYDGVLPFAPQPDYGTPDALRAFIAAAHAQGIAVMIDVVLNHFGPDGAWLHEIAPGFFDPDRHTPWGAGIDFSQPAVRAFLLENTRMWIADYHADGLRIDAAHQIVDRGDPHMLDEIARTARAAAPGRTLWLVTEDERNIDRHVTPGGALHDAQWNDDYHHALHCLLTGEDESYYAPFAVDPLGDLVLALTEGQVDQGQPRPGAPPRGAPSAHLPFQAFVNANQTHDQVGNRARGERLIALAGEEAARTAHALLLLLPFVPMLFMGEEAGEAAPFQFFVGFEGELAEATRRGRQAEFAKFRSFGGAVPDPADRATFEASRPYVGAAPRAEDWRALTRQLLSLRRSMILPLLRSGPALRPEVSRAGAAGIVARYRWPGGGYEIRAALGQPLPAAVAPPPPAVAASFALGDIYRDAFALALHPLPAASPHRTATEPRR